MLREDIISGAMSICGAHYPGDTLTTAENNRAVLLLDALLVDLEKETELWSKTIRRMFKATANIPTVNLAAMSKYQGNPLLTYMQLTGSLTATPTTSAAGPPTAYSATIAGFTYTAGSKCIIQLDVANTGAATLNINALGAKNIRREGETLVATGDLIAGQILEIVYDGTNFHILEPSNVSESLLRLISAAEWAEITNKTQLGVPDRIFIDQSNIGFLFPIPSLDGWVHAQYTQTVNASAAATAPDMPTEWGLAIQYGLALELAPDYMTPIPDRNEIERQWLLRKSKLISQDVQQSHVTVSVEDNG